MNDVNTHRGFTPKIVITAYADKNHHYYLEQREVKNIAGKTMLMAPIPMAADALKDVAKAYMKKNAAEMDFGGWVAPHLLYGSNKPGKCVVVWYRNAMQRSLNFCTSVINLKNTIVKVPATLYVVINNKMYVYALPNNERPTMKTKLYNAPFFNIYTTGNVCLGTAHVGKNKTRTFELEAERYERGFYMAEQNGGQSVNACKTKLTILWPRLIKSQAAFPSKTELRQHPTYKTLGVLMNKLIDANITDND